MRNDFVGVPACTPSESSDELTAPDPGSGLLILADSTAGLRNLNGVRRIPFEDLRALIGENPVPKLVLTPVFGNRFDVYDVAQILSDQGYGGDLRRWITTFPTKKSLRTKYRRRFPS